MAPPATQWASLQGLCVSRELCRGWWGVPGVSGWMYVGWEVSSVCVREVVGVYFLLLQKWRPSLGFAGKECGGQSSMLHF